MSGPASVATAGATLNANLRDPVPGSLNRRLRFWRSITNDRWILKTIRRGLKLNFVDRPTASKFLPNHPLTPDQRAFVTTELARLVLVGAVSRLSARPLLCLPLGVVPKKNGKWRLIHDLRFLNSRIRRPPRFKLEDLSTVAQQVKEGDQLMTFDLEQGYYHVEINAAYRKYFGFEWDGQFYQWNVLPFGLSEAPLVFTKILRPVVQHLRSLNLRVNLYLDDFLLMVAAGKSPALDRDTLLQALARAGLHVNLEKSVLTPSTSAEYLGLEINTNGPPTFRVPPSKLRKIRHEISRRLRDTAPFPARYLARLAGLCVSTLRAILPGRMLLRNVYRQVSGVNLDRIIVLSPGSRQDLEWWLHALSHWNGAAALPLPADMTLPTDASDSGWGATLDDRQARGSWTHQKTSRHHINSRELEAALLGLRSFLPLVSDKSVLLRSDNVTVVASINKLYGRSPRLNSLVRQIFDLCREHKITLRAMWIPGKTNLEADRLSRAADPSDWELTDIAFKLIDFELGPHTVDRMASSTNSKLRRFNSRLYDPRAEAVNCFAQDWSGESNFVVPPFGLIPAVLRHVQHCKAEATIIVPIWTTAWWWRLLLRLATRPPLLLGSAPGNFRAGPSGRVEPFRNPHWDFAAFRISGCAI